MCYSHLRHFLYHIYPVRGSLWKFNVNTIAPRLGLFNGRRVVNIAIDDRTESYQTVIDAFRTSDITFVVSENCTTHEVQPFIETLLPSVSRLDGCTFYAHAKGTSYGGSDLPNIRHWIRRMIDYNLNDETPKFLETHEAVGIYRRVMEHCGSSWHYSGSFFWFRNEAVFQRRDRDWKQIANDRFGVEAYPGRIIPLDQSICLFGDNAPDLYGEVV